MKLNKSEISALARQILAAGQKANKKRKEELRESLHPKAIEQMVIFETLDSVIREDFCSNYNINDFLNPLVNAEISNGYLLKHKRFEVLEDEILLALKECKTLDDIRARVGPYEPID